MPRGNPENLIKPTQAFTAEERQKRASHAGKASAKARAKKRDLAQLLMLLLSQPMSDNPDIDNYEGITASLIKRALDGDTKAYEIVRDTIGQKPIDKAEITTNTIKVNIE